MSQYHKFCLRIPRRAGGRCYMVRIQGSNEYTLFHHTRHALSCKCCQYYCRISSEKHQIGPAPWLNDASIVGYVGEILYNPRLR